MFVFVSQSLSLILLVLCSYFCLDKFNQEKGKTPLETEIDIKENKNKNKNMNLPRFILQRI